MKRLVFFGSKGIGEVILMTPMLRKLAQNYNLTLVVPKWHVPIFEKLDWLKGQIRYIEEGARFTDDPKGIELTDSFAKELELPEAQWCAPISRNIYLNNQRLANELPRTPFKDQKNRIIVEKLSREYGIGDFDYRLEISKFKQGRDRDKPTIAICNSAESLRRIPPHVMCSIMDKFIGLRFLFIGFQGEYNESNLKSPYNELEFHWTKHLDPKRTAFCCQQLERASLFLGTDCGWAWMAMAQETKTIIFESRHPFESSVDPRYWDRATVFKKTELTCNQMCSAQRLVLARENPADQEPCRKWENYKCMSKEWKEKYYGADYPRQLECFSEPFAPCLSLSDNDIERLIEKMIEFVPGLTQHFFL